MRYSNRNHLGVVCFWLCCWAVLAACNDTGNTTVIGPVLDTASGQDTAASEDVGTDADALPDTHSSDSTSAQDTALPPMDIAPDVGTDTGGSDTTEPEPPPEALSILFIGNSFTYYGPVPDIVETLAIDAGWPAPDVHSSTSGGKSLGWHLNNMPTLDLVDRGGWDVVVLQELSTKPTDASIGDPASFKADATTLYDRIQVSSPGARVVLYETFARHPDHSLYPNTYADPADMQAQLRFHYNDAANNHIPANSTTAPYVPVVVAPVGDAWEHHLSQPGALRLHDSDDWHPNSSGEYLNALVIYSVIYERATLGLPPWELVLTESNPLQTSADAITGMTQTGGPSVGGLVGLEPGDVVFVDWGTDDTQDAAWNNVGDNAGRGYLLNTSTSVGRKSSVDVVVTTRFGGGNEAGNPNNTLGFPGTASVDSLYAGSFDGHTAALLEPGAFEIQGLDGGAYNITLFASRNGTDSGRGRLTRYTINDVSQDLEVGDNTNNTVVFESVTPDENGAIAVDVAVSPDGASRFAYVGVLIIEAL